MLRYPRFYVRYKLCKATRVCYVMVLDILMTSNHNSPCLQGLVWNQFGNTDSEAAVQDVLKKRCCENMQQIYTRPTMQKCNFNKVAHQLIEITLRHGYSPVHLLHIFRTPFPRNTSGWLLLQIIIYISKIENLRRQMSWKVIFYLVQFYT